MDMNKSRGEEDGNNTYNFTINCFEGDRQSQ